MQGFLPASCSRLGILRSPSFVNRHVLDRPLWLLLVLPDVLVSRMDALPEDLVCAWHLAVNREASVAGPKPGLSRVLSHLHHTLVV